jgi:hypothetical protein
VAVVAPAGTVTVAGTWAAAALLLVRLTTVPPTCAGPVSVTVPVDDSPPSTVAGLTLTAVSPATSAVTVRVAVRETLLWVAVIVTGVSAATGLVVTVNMAVVAPAATVILTGSCAAAVLLLVRLTTIPPAGAGPLSVTVPIDDAPPSSVAGLTLTALRPETAGGSSGEEAVSQWMRGSTAVPANDHLTKSRLFMITPRPA